MYCRKCDRELPESAFGVRHTPQGDVPRMPCKECDNKAKQAYWRSKHPLKDRPPVDPVKEQEKEQTRLRREEKRRLKAEGKKRCTVCGEIKFLQEFHPYSADGYSATCRECQKEKIRQRDGYYERAGIRERWKQTREESGQRYKRWQEKLDVNRGLMKEGKRWCPHCQQALPLEKFGKRQDGSCLSWCRECSRPSIQEGARRYKERKREARQVSLHQCSQCGKMVAWEDYCPTVKKCNSCVLANKELRRQHKQVKKREQRKVRSKIDGAYRLQCRIGENLRKLLKGQKSGSSLKWIGCTKAFLKEYVASRFTEGMSWDNYGEWHLDHIIPQAFFDFNDTEQVRICWNYRNLQPLWRQDNLNKSDGLPEGFVELFSEIKSALS